MLSIFALLLGSWLRIGMRILALRCASQWCCGIGRRAGLIWFSWYGVEFGNCRGCRTSAQVGWPSAKDDQDHLRGGHFRHRDGGFLGLDGPHLGWRGCSPAVRLRIRTFMSLRWSVVHAYSNFGAQGIGVAQGAGQARRLGSKSANPVADRRSCGKCAMVKSGKSTVKSFQLRAGPNGNG